METGCQIKPSKAIFGNHVITVSRIGPQKGEPGCYVTKTDARCQILGPSVDSGSSVIIIIIGYTIVFSKKMGAAIRLLP